jgi:FkbM family methyltransferase
LVRSMLLPEAYSWISFEGYEPEGLAWVREHVRAGDVCLDVGAHIGVYTTLLAELVGDGGHIYTFEPFPASRRCLTATLDANGLARRVTAVRAAVDAEDGGTVDLHVGTSGPDASEASLLPHSTRTTMIAVPRVSLDAFVESNGLPRVNLIKMDIEGGEVRALQGATRTLECCRPPVLLEAHGELGTEAIKLLRRRGYTVTGVRVPRGISLEADTNRQVIGIPVDQK